MTSPRSSSSPAPPGRRDGVTGDASIGTAAEAADTTLLARLAGAVAIFVLVGSTVVAFTTGDLAGRNGVSPNVPRVTIEDRVRIATQSLQIVVLILLAGTALARRATIDTTTKTLLGTPALIATVYAGLNVWVSLSSTGQMTFFLPAAFSRLSIVQGVSFGILSAALSWWLLLRTAAPDQTTPADEPPEVLELEPDPPDW